MAEKYNVTREEMDRLALESHRKAAAAQDAGYFDEQIIPLPGVDAEGNEIVFDKDQGIRRDTTLEKMASMKPCFRENGRVTAATSSQTSDGAAFLVLMSRDKAAEMGIRPTLDGLRVDPCIPHTLTGYTVTRRFRGAEYRITVDNAAGVQHGVKAVTVDGKAICGNVLPLAAAGTEVTVQVTMG